MRGQDRYTGALSCPGCATVIPLAERHWLRLVGDFIREDLRTPRGESDNTEVLAPWGEFSVEHGHCDPVCPHCGQKLPEATWHRLAGSLDCPACKREVAVRPPPDWFAKVNPAARWLVGETFEAKRKPWSIVLETGATSYILPEDIEDFCDVAHAPDGCLIAAFIEESDYDENDEMKVRADGTLYLGNACNNLRVVSSDGKLVFRSPATVELDDVDRQRYEKHN